MGFDGVAWMIHNATHSAELGRQQAFMATSGGRGVVLPEDLKVRAMDAPGDAIVIAPGGAALPNRYPGGDGQSYGIRNRADFTFQIPATDVNPRTDYIIARIVDPQYPGQAAPADIKLGPFVFVERVATLNGIDYPFVELAKITIPANTAAIDDGMIEDLRRLAQPRSVGDALQFLPTGIGDAGHAMPTGGYASWPITGADRPTIYIPEWANTLKVLVHMSGILYRSASSARSVAGVRTGFGTEGSENGIIIEAGTGDKRPHYTAAGSHEILEYQRGTDQAFNIQAVRTEGTGMWYADYQSVIAVDYSMTEKIR